MSGHAMARDGGRVGFVATRLAGTDGVSLEARKWRQALERLDFECYCFCSETDWPPDRACLSPAAGIAHDDVRDINRALFEDGNRTHAVGRRVTALKEALKKDIAAYVKRFDLSLLIAENALSLPMNLPLGLALTEYIAETRIPTLAHHHDFWWERDRYAASPAEDLLRSAFPATLPSIRHVVINSVAGRELAFRTGTQSTLIPNVMDFAHPPEPTDDYAADLREQLGIAPGEKLILQPTRIVPRKRIEKAVELVRRLEVPCALVVTHEAGDEGYEYAHYLRELADLLGVRLLMPTERFDNARGRTADGAKIYALEDAYRQADLVAYCSAIEGFGNAFLETIYHSRPLLMSAYEIFTLDVRPKGFEVLSFRDFIPRELVDRVEDVLRQPEHAAAWVARNYELGRRHYSFEALDARLRHVVDACIAQC